MSADGAAYTAEKHLRQLPADTRARNESDQLICRVPALNWPANLFLDAYAMIDDDDVLCESLPDASGEPDPCSGTVIWQIPAHEGAFAGATP
jgi:hypothetical protein